MTTHHYRTVPYTFDPDSELGVFRTLKEAIAEFHFVSRGEDDEYSWDLYANDSDEPTVRLTLGPRGGVAVDRH